jgi:polar amino acid transport system substrate-binding protein
VGLWKDYCATKGACCGPGANWWPAQTCSPHLGERAHCLKGKTLGSDTGSANEAWLVDNKAKYGPYTIKSYDYWVDAALDLEAGRIDGVVVDDPIALYYIKEHPKSNLVMPIYMPGFKAGQALAFKKGSPLRNEFNKIQNEMKKDGALAAIHKKWFGVAPPADSSTVNIWGPYWPNEKPTK